eukprot:85172_1
MGCITSTPPNVHGLSGRKSSSERKREHSLDPLKYAMPIVCKAIKNSDIIMSLDIPSEIVNEIVSWYPIEHLELKIEPFMIQYVSAEDYSVHYSLQKVFEDEGTYCTKVRNTDVEILIRLTASDPSDPMSEDLCNTLFVITEVSVEAPFGGFTAPIETFVMWAFADEPPNMCDYDTRIKYAGKTDCRYSDDHCVSVLKNIHQATYSWKTDYLFDADHWIRAKYILIKFMATGPNVDTKRFRIKVLRM